MAYMQFEGPGFFMQVPTNWLVTSNENYQAIFVGPESGSASRPNLMVAIRPLHADATVTMIAEQAREVQAEQYPNYRVLEEIDYTQDGGSGFRRSYQWYDDESRRDIVQMQAFFAAGPALFTLTATRTADQPASVDEIFDHMLNSFQLKVS